MSRQYSEVEYNQIKTATKRVLADLGGADAAEPCTRVRRSQLFDYGNVFVPEKFVPADVIMDLEKVGGAPHITAALARAQGYMLVMIETPPHGGALAALLAEIGRDVGELFATATTALTHSELSAAERLDLLRELGDLNRVTGQVISYLSKGSEP